MPELNHSECVNPDGYIEGRLDAERAGLVKQVDTAGLNPAASGHDGSSPSSGTIEAIQAAAVGKEREACARAMAVVEAARMIVETYDAANPLDKALHDAIAACAALTQLAMWLILAPGRGGDGMGGLARTCKMYGAMTINGRRFVWDYVKDCAVPEDEMTPEDRRDSDRAWAEALRARLTAPQSSGATPRGTGSRGKP